MGEHPQQRIPRHLSEAQDAFFRGREVRDATKDEPLTLLIRLEDILGAVPGDPSRCVAARAATRQLGSDSRGVLFYRTEAYVDVGPHILRYRLYTDAQRIVDELDRTGTVVADGPIHVRLIPPTPSQTIAAKRDRDRTRRKMAPRVVRARAPKALVRGTSAYMERVVKG